jgi:hypothetical protein
MNFFISNSIIQFFTLDKNEKKRLFAYGFPCYEPMRWAFFVRKVVTLYVHCTLLIIDFFSSPENGQEMLLISISQKFSDALEMKKKAERLVDINRL